MMEKAPRLTEIKSEPRAILKNKKGYKGLVIPSYPLYDVNTADLKVIVYHKWFALEDESDLPSTFRKVMRNNSLSTLFDPITKPELPKVIYLLHHDKFPIFIANADTLDTATNGGATFQLENLAGTPIAAGRIKRFEIVPSSLGNLAPEVFDRVVQWAYTGDYQDVSISPDNNTILEGDHLDKKIAIAALLMGHEDLFALTIEKLRVRMDDVADKKERNEEAQARASHWEKKRRSRGKKGGKGKGKDKGKE